jgi:glucosyl-dolichyl phosphate glucuronosyltransferase
VAVVVPTCDMQKYDKLCGVLGSILHQSRKASEIIVIANGSCELGDRLKTAFAHCDGMQIIVTADFLSGGQARNVGIKASHSDIIAFTDDDSIPDRRWIEELVKIYLYSDAIAVGGKVLPVWLTDEPSFLPEELYWLVGATHEKIFKDAVAEVRNTFGPNMSYKKNVLESVGYFDERLGFRGADNYLSRMGGEEQDLGLRVLNKYGKGIIYNPEAIVYHDVPKAKTELAPLIKRAFYFGISKRLILRMDRFKNNMDTERSYMGKIVTDFIPGHIKNIFTGPSRVASAKKLAFLLLVVAVIGAGFIYGHVGGK